jgi:hypothetical protein
MLWELLTRRPWDVEKMTKKANRLVAMSKQ